MALVPAPVPEVKEPGQFPLSWRLTYAPVGNELTLALLDGKEKPQVLALERLALPDYMSEEDIGFRDTRIEEWKLKLLCRYREAQRLITKHAGPCAPDN